VLRLFGIDLRHLPPLATQLPNLVDDGIESLFDEDGALLAPYLEYSTAAAIRAATLLARSQGAMVGSGALVLGFGATGSRTLHEAFLALGDAAAGASALAFAATRSLIPFEGDLGLAQFSARTWRALENAVGRARQAGRRLVGDADVLVMLLADEEATARGVAETWGVDPDALSAVLAAS
jgi:hypothetical protein